MPWLFWPMSELSGTGGLNGKVAFITGAAVGFGRAFARSLVR